MADAEGLEHERRQTLVNIELVIAADDDWKSKGNPGLMAALKAARVARARVAVPVFDDRREDGDTDFNDLACAHGAEAVQEDIAAAVEPDVLMEKMLLAEPNSAFRPAWIQGLAALRQRDLARYEELLAKLKKAKVGVGALDREAKAALAAAAKAAARSSYKTPPAVDATKLAASAKEIIACHDVLEMFAEECGQVIAGEETLTKLLYLSATSRLLDKAMHVAVKGPSAVGKSEGRRRVLEFFPRKRSFRSQLCRKKPSLLQRRFCAQGTFDGGGNLSGRDQVPGLLSAGTLKRRNTPLPCRAEAARWHARDCHYHQKWPGRLHGDHDAEQAPPGERNPHVVGGGQ